MPRAEWSKKPSSYGSPTTVMGKIGGGVGALYLLVGKDRYLKREFIERLRTKFFPKSADLASNFQELPAGERPLGETFDFLRTAPFLAERRMAVLWQVEALDDEDREGFLSKAEGLPDTAILVLVAEEGTPKKDGFLRELSLKADLVSCYLPKREKLPNWVRAQAEKKGLKISGEACLFLAETMGEDAAAISRAVEQLGLMVSPKNSAELKDAVALFGRPLKQSVFELIDVLLKGNTAVALRSFETLFEEGADVLDIVPLLASQIDRLRRTRFLVDAGLAEGEIARQAKIHPFYLRDTLRQAALLSDERARALLAKLAACEEEIKTDRIAERTAFEFFVAEACV